MADIFLIGCGYLGTLVSQRWGKDNRSPVALARSEASASKLQALGITSYRGNLDDATSLKGLPLADSTLYYFAPPPSKGKVDTRMRNLTASLDSSNAPSRIIYVSTSGVYGDCKGARVNEETPLNPQADRARRRVDAEKTLSGWCNAHHVPLTILRVAGIYGPDKLPLKRLKAGTPVLREEECGYSNRIHIEDLVDICIAAAKRESEGIEIYNVSDGHPSTMTAYFNAVADTLGLPRPPVISMEAAKQQLTPAMLSYLTESRRLDNGKLLRGLGIVLKYPTLGDGLRALVVK